MRQSAIVSVPANEVKVGEVLGKEMAFSKGRGRADQDEVHCFAPPA